MILIDRPLNEPLAPGETRVSIEVDRRTLAKRRWRGTAEDGTAFGFDLHKSLNAGDVIHRVPGTCYIIQLAAENLLEISWPKDTRSAVALAWQIGNLHFPLQACSGCMRTVDDQALRQMLDRTGIQYHECREIFEPLAAASGHGHHHHHDH